MAEHLSLPVVATDSLPHDHVYLRDRSSEKLQSQENEAEGRSRKALGHED